MNVTSLRVVKTGKNEFLVEVQVHRFTDLFVRRVGQIWGHVSSIEELTSFLSLTNHRETQRVGSSMRFSHRCRTTKYGATCLSVSWDGKWRGEFTTFAEFRRCHEARISEMESRAKGPMVEWELLPFSFSLDHVIDHASRSVVKH